VLILLEPVGIDFCPAVVDHRAHDLVTDTFRKVRGNLQPNSHIRGNLTNEMRDHLLGNPAGVAECGEAEIGFQQMSGVEISVRRSCARR